ncbi:MAG: peptide chain release factor 1 [Candidatus Wallbacteria bacterium]|nr:peptide chain release factor 1 [Candidatus Wallbacteria bacterium]
MLKRIEELEIKYEELTQLLTQEQVIKNQTEFQRIAKERSGLEEIITALREFRKVSNDLESTRSLLDSEDRELREVAREEMSGLERRKNELELIMKLLVLPKDPRDNRDIIMEIRAGAGGEEAALFAGTLFRMYNKYAEKGGMQLEVLSGNTTGLGGFKEVIFGLKGKSVYSRFKFESGVHRVQRVPTTEASGRIHTSTVTVAVMPEAEEVEVEINLQDLKIDVCRSSGAGGQNVNKLETAVRITHLPTGLVVSCQDERSQLQNKLRAMKILRARLLEKKQAEEHEKMSREKKQQLGSGDRSEKIRTYNFPQSRLTDHRIGLSLFNLPQILEGDLDELFESLIKAEQEEKLKEFSINTQGREK